MKIALSNLAWDRGEDKKILSLLLKYNISGIEIAPTKIWDHPTKISDKNLKTYKNMWLNSGIQIVAITSLLFGHPELQIFSDQKTREQTIEYLSHIIRLSSYLGAKAMVFGSPKNRSTFGLPKKEVEKISEDFFYQVALIAKKFGIFFGLEANPSLYGTNFINTTDEAINLVKKVNHPNFRLHMDCGTMTINKEDYTKTIDAGFPYTCHFQISEPGLKPIPTKLTNHKKIAKTLKDLNYNKWISIEMPLQKYSRHLFYIERALKFVKKNYE